MPPARRLRLVSIVAVVCILALLLTSRLRGADSSDAGSPQQGVFVDKTKTPVDRGRVADEPAAGAKAKAAAAKGQASPPDKSGVGGGDLGDEAAATEMSERLRAAEQKAKDLANSKAPNKPDLPGKLVGVGSSAGGQTAKKKSDGPVVIETEEKEKPLAQVEEDNEIKIELESILRKSPVIIFSKSYCPYSKRAKGVLLEKYTIQPAPYVVELDQHPLGPQIQAELGQLTGRKTVPNILVNGKSIGGGDEITAMDRDKTLITKIKSLGSKRVTMKERFAENEAAKKQ